jgi:hypothetical protein
MSQGFLRHTLATLAYRGGKAVRGAPASFSSFRPAAGSRSAGEILAHVCDLLDWGVSIARGQEEWRNSTPGEWDADVARFFASLGTLDAAIASGSTGWSLEGMFQGPVADALTHVGQLTMLRRLAGGPIRGENYHIAAIAAGRVGADQPAPRFEFD